MFLRSITKRVLVIDAWICTCRVPPIDNETRHLAGRDQSVAIHRAGIWGLAAAGDAAVPGLLSMLG